MAYENNNYVETRFPGGMNSSVEPHTLDRDTGELPDIFNMLTRTEGLRTRPGWKLAQDLSGSYSNLPVLAPTGIFEYDSGLVTEAAGDEEEGDENGADDTIGGTVVPVTDDSSSGASGGSHKPPTGDQPTPPPTPTPTTGSYVLTATPLPIMPYVPFTLKLTGVGLGASLEPTTLSVKMVPSASASAQIGVLETDGTGKWKRRIVVKTINARAQKVSFTATATRQDVSGTAEFAYALYSFTPNLPARVSAGTTFTFTITCSYNGSTVTGYIGNGAGLSRSFSFLDSDGSAADGVVNVGSVSWSNGVLTGTATCYPGANAARLRLTTTFAGTSAHDDALLEVGDWNVYAPNSLHVMGPAKQLTIMAANEILEYPDIYIMNSQAVAADVLEDEYGNALDFSSSEYSGTTWQHDVRAKSSASAGTYDIAAYIGDDPVADDEVEIYAGLRANLMVRSFVKENTSFGMYINIKGDNNDTLTRFTPSAVTIALKDETGADASSLFTFESGVSFSNAASWSNGTWSHDLSCSAAGKYTLFVYDARNNTLVNSVSFEVVEAGTQVKIEVPSSLHVFGAGGLLTIALLKDGLPLPDGDTDRPTIAFTDDAGGILDYTDYIETADGNEVDFSTGWDHGQWSQTIRAKSSALETLVRFEATFIDENLNEYSDTDVTEITRNLQAEIDTEATRVPANTNFNLKITVSSPRGEELTRLPVTGGVTVVHGEEENGTAEMLDSATGSSVVFNNFVSGVSNHTCYIDQECVYVIEVYDGAKILATESITVANGEIDLAALVEAINERIPCRTGGNSVSPVDVSDNLQDIKTAAGYCIVSYLVGDVGSGGSYTEYTNSTGPAAIPALPQDLTDTSAVQQWVEDTYDVVKAAVEVVYSSLSISTDAKYYYGFGREEVDDAPDAQTIRRMLRKARRKAIENYGLSNGSGDATAHILYGQNGQYSTRQDYIIALMSVRYKVTLGNTTAAATQRYYMQYQSWVDEFETFGHKVTAENAIAVNFKTTSAKGEQPDWTDYQGLSRPSVSSLELAPGDFGLRQLGYKRATTSSNPKNFFCVVTYRFKHR